MRLETVLTTLYVFIFAPEVTYVYVYREPRLKTKEASTGVLFPLPGMFVDDMRTKGLYIAGVGVPI